MTALILACHKGHIECVTVLCSFGADLSLRDREGSTALMIATRKGHLECVAILLEYMNVQQLNLTNSFSKCAYDYATNDEMKALYMKNFNSILYSDKQHLKTPDVLRRNVSNASLANSFVTKMQSSEVVTVNNSSPLSSKVSSSIDEATADEAKSKEIEESKCDESKNKKIKLTSSSSND